MTKVARVRLSDGRVGRFSVADDATPDDARRIASEWEAKQKPAAAAAPAKAPTLASRALNAVGANSAFARGVGDVRSFGFLDEVGAALDTIGIGGSGEQRPNIWNAKSLRGASEAFQQNLARNRQQLKESQEQAPGQFLAGQVVGAVAPGPGGRVVAGTRLGQTAQRVGQFTRAIPTSRAGQAAARVVTNAAPDVARAAAYGFGSAEGGTGQRLQAVPGEAALGFGGNVAGQMVGKVGQRILRGKTLPNTVRGRAIRTLADEGIVMTPGKRGGAIKRSLEEGLLGSLPVARLAPQAANRRSIEQLNRAAYNRVLRPIGHTVDRNIEPGRQAIVAVGDVVNTTYDAAIQQLALHADRPLNLAVARINNRALNTVGDSAAPQLRGIVNETMEFLNQGPITGSRVRDVLQDLRNQAYGFRGSSVRNEQNMGDQLLELYDELEDALMRQNRADVVTPFRNARSARQLLFRVEDAAAKAGGDGVFNPTQFHQAVTRRGYGVNTGRVARGEANMQDLSDAAKLILPNTIPNSGTPERVAALSLLGGGGAGTALGAINPAVAGLTGLSLGAYIPGVDRALQAMQLNRPQAFRQSADALESFAPQFGQAGRAATLGMFGQQPAPDPQDPRQTRFGR